jgi:hypothetical protein
LLPKHLSTSCLRPAADDRPARDNDQSALPGQRVEAHRVQCRPSALSGGWASSLTQPERTRTCGKRWTICLLRGHG